MADCGLEVSEKPNEYSAQRLNETIMAGVKSEKVMLMCDENWKIKNDETQQNLVGHSKNFM